MEVNGNGRDAPDLRALIETRIPEHRGGLERTYGSLENVARYCEENYLKHQDKQFALEETKQFALQSLASVAYQIDVIARDLLDMLELETQRIDSLSWNVKDVDMSVRLQKEKIARRDIGMLTTNKTIVKQNKIDFPSHQETIPRYRRTPIDFSLLDGIGHGVKTVDAPTLGRGTGYRTPSSASGNYGHYLHYNSPSNLTNTLSRASMRSAASTLQAEHHYRVPQSIPMVEPSRMSSTHSNYQTTPTYQSPIYQGTNNTYTAGSYQSSATYQSLPYQATPTYQGTPTNSEGRTSGRSPLPFRDDDPLPPPPALLDTSADWVPTTYLEKAIALYDYDADKPDELTLRANCTVYVLRKNEDGWFEGVLDGVTGLFPGNYVVPAQ